MSIDRGDVATDPRAVAVRSIQIMADGDRADFDDVVHPDARNHEDEVEPPAARVGGPAGYHATALWLRTAFAEDGKVIDHWANRDDLGQAKQLGWVPPTPLYLVKMAQATSRARRALR